MLTPHPLEAAPSLTGRRWQPLVRRADFVRLTGSSLRRAAPGFVLQAAPRPEPGPLRIGFTASRKLGNAVARNRAKRRLRALADLVMADANPALDYVLVGRPDSLTRAFAAMADDLRHALKRIAERKPAPQREPGTRS